MVGLTVGPARLVEENLPHPTSYESPFELRYLLDGDRVVPVPLPRGYRQLVADETVLEEVEHGELVPRHDVCVRLCLDLGPGLRHRGL